MKNYQILFVFMLFLLTGCGSVSEVTPPTEMTSLKTAEPLQTTQTSVSAPLSTTTTKTTTQTTATNATTTPLITTDTTIITVPTEAPEITNPPSPVLETEAPPQEEIILPEDSPADSLPDTITEAVPIPSDDTTAPILTNDGNGAQVQIGTVFNLDNLVGYADDLDPHPVLTYSGNVDTSAYGSYPITATVTDSSGNFTTWNLTVNVVGQVSAPSDNQSTEYFSDFVANHAGENCRYGIDVSKWQADIDFNAVRDAGCSFVLMRIGYGGNSISADQYYYQNMENAVNAGLDVGVYFYSTASTQEEARFQADWIAGELNGRALQFPVVFDWESFSNFQKYGMSLYDLNAMYDAFADQMAQHGYPTMLYSSKSRLGNIWRTEGRPIWLAHYTSYTNYDGDYSIWQQSSHGRINGISEEVDFNILYTDRIYW